MSAKARPGIALPVVLAVLVALGLLSALALGDAIREWRVASLTEDALRSRAAALAALTAVGTPPDLPGLCTAGPLNVQARDLPAEEGAAGRIAWRSLGQGLIRAEAEGRGPLGSLHRFTLLTRPDTAERVMGLFRCPSAARLVPMGGGWPEGRP